MKIHQALHFLDFTVIAAYLVLLLGLGFWVSFRNKRAQEDLFLGGRTLPWYNVGLSIFGTNIGPSFLIASCSIAYTSGVVGANFEWLAWWFLMLLGMLFIPHYMGNRVKTMPQFMERRFDLVYTVSFRGMPFSPQSYCGSAVHFMPEAFCSVRLWLGRCGYPLSHWQLLHCC